MALKIVKSTDTVNVENLKTLIYAPPGTGKTTTAFTASKPILFDFDNGAYRAGNRQDTVNVSAWADVVGVTEEDLKGYDSVIIDTAGRMLDVIAAHIVKTNPKAAKRDGTLSINGFGTLKSIFDSFMSKLIGMRKDVILIAHEKEVRINDELTVMRPDIQGGSLNIVKRAMDLIGYIHIEGGKRYLDFNPNERTFGKNSAALPALLIPDITRPEFDTFLAEVHKRAKDYINQQAASGADFYMFKRKIGLAEKPQEFDAISSEIQAQKEEGLKRMLRALVVERITQVGVEYSKKASKFIYKAEGQEGQEGEAE